MPPSLRRLLFSILLLSAVALARVDRVDVQRREDILGGRAWGSAGAYEKLSGRVYFKVRPADPHNRAIVDLDKAGRNAAGEVEFSADFYLLRPKDPAKGNGALLLEISNRGGKGILGIVNNGRGGPDPTTEQDFGDGFLLNHGYTVAWVGWQFDAIPGANLMHLYAPIAHGPNGEHIRGMARTDFTLDSDREEAMPLGHWIQNRLGGFGYPAADPASGQNVLTVRDTPTSPRMVIPRDQWQFGANNKTFKLSGGFHKGRIYELVYVAQDPVVVGLGFAAIRDFVSYAKHDPQAVAPVKRVYGVGISQSGRFLRHMLYQDFNADEQGRIVFDGMIPHVAGAGRGSFNHRFAQPSRDAQPMNALFYPTDIFPFADTVQTDPLTGEQDGLLVAATRSHTVPKMFLTNTSYEYWGRAAALIHVSPDGKRDLTPSPNVRIYYEAGLQHYSDAFPPRATAGQNANNPNPVRWFWRAMIANLDAWVARGVEPPASVYPKLADGTLVTLDAMRFPYLQSTFLPRDANMGFHVDYGPEFKSKGIVAHEPPIVGPAFPIFVPKPNADGEDTGGVTLPELSVPLATYTGWNLRSPQTGAPTQRVSFVGSYLPLAKTKADREANGDPRPSIAERYSGKEQYLDLYRKAAEKLVEQRFLLSDDLPTMLQHAAEEWDFANKP